MELVAVLDGDLSKGLQKFQIGKISLKILSCFFVTWKSRSSIAFRIFSVLDGTLYSARY